MLGQFRPADEDVLSRFAIPSLSPSCGPGAVPNLLAQSALDATNEFPFILSKFHSFDAVSVALFGYSRTQTQLPRVLSPGCITLEDTFLFPS